MASRFGTKLEGFQELFDNLEALGVDTEATLKDAVQASGELVADAANPNAPGPNIVAKLNDEESSTKRIVVDIGYNKHFWYYQFGELGATAHEISGRNGKSLAFPGREGLVITKSVQHPGVTAKPFLRPALAGNRDTARDEIGKYVLNVVNKNVE